MNGIKKLHSKIISGTPILFILINDNEVISDQYAALSAALYPVTLTSKLKLIIYAATVGLLS